MSKFGDKIKSIFTVDYDDDYEDDYYDDYEDDEMEIEQEKPLVRPKKERTVVKEEVPVRQTRTRAVSQPSRTTTRASRSKVVPMRGNSSNDMEVCVIKPTYFESTRDIIDTLLEGKSVVLNLEGIKLDLAQRIIDSVSGGCYAIQGNLQKISGYIYLVTPNSVGITGDFQELVSESSDYSSSFTRRNY